MTARDRRRASRQPPAEPGGGQPNAASLPDSEQTAPCPKPTSDQGEAIPIPDGDQAIAIPIEDALDLHSFAPKDIAGVVADYLEECARRGLQEVRLIHGRGTGAQRALVRSLLGRLPQVTGFEDAPPERGGWGATVVFLQGDLPAH
jgi:DNA-nicking Smr family endonuclease